MLPLEQVAVLRWHDWSGRLGSTPSSLGGKGVLLEKSLHGAVVFSGCGDSPRAGRRVPNCPARELYYHNPASLRDQEACCLYPELHKSKEWVGPWGAEIPVPRVEDAPCKVGRPARQMQRTQTALTSFQNSPSAVTRGLSPEPAFHFWLHYELLSWPEPWGVPVASSPPHPMLCRGARASTVPRATLPCVCASTSSIHTICRPWGPPQLSLPLSQPHVSQAGDTVAISPALPPSLTPFQEPRPWPHTWLDGVPLLLLLGSSPVSLTLPVNSAWAGHSTFCSLFPFPDTFFSPAAPESRLQALPVLCYRGSGVPMLSHGGGLYHSRPAGLLLPLLRQPLTWTCSLDGSCHLWPRGRDEPGVMKGSKCSRRPCFQGAPQVCSLQTCGHPEEWRELRLPIPSTSPGTIEVGWGPSRKFCAQLLPPLRLRRVLGLVTTCSPALPSS